MQHPARHYNSELLEHAWECGYIQWNTRYADGFLDQLVLHHIKADKFLTVIEGMEERSR